MARATLPSFQKQIAGTSSYLANVVFWRREHSVVERFDKLGWTYSRLVDDITVSKAAAVEPDELTNLAVGFLQRYRYSVKRSKHKVMRRNHRMTVNGL